METSPPPASTSRRPRALLVRAGALGDILLLRRAVASLRAAGHRVALLAPASSGGVLVGPGASEVDALLPWDRAEVATLLSEEGVPPGALRDELAGFDLAVAYTRSAALVRNLSALVPRVVAHDPQPPPGSGHASAWLAQGLLPLGLLADPAPAPLTTTAAEESAVQPLLRALPPGFLALHPGSGSASKCWPAERFAGLVQALDPDRPWLLVQGPAEPRLATALAERRGRVAARELPARSLGALLARAGLFVGNDSGVSHLAAAFGAPTVALFGPTDPEVWAPLGDRVRVVRSGDGRMEGIAIEDVLRAAAAT